MVNVGKYTSPIWIHVWYSNLPRQISLPICKRGKPSLDAPDGKVSHWKRCRCVFELSAMIFVGVETEVESTIKCLDCTTTRAPRNLVGCVDWYPIKITPTYSSRVNDRVWRGFQLSNNYRGLFTVLGHFWKNGSLFLLLACWSEMAWPGLLVLHQSYLSRLILGFLR